jgi:hypothetical protein
MLIAKMSALLLVFYKLLSHIHIVSYFRSSNLIYQQSASCCQLSSQQFCWLMCWWWTCESCYEDIKSERPICSKLYHFSWGFLHREYTEKNLRCPKPNGVTGFRNFNIELYIGKLYNIAFQQPKSGEITQ